MTIYNIIEMNSIKHKIMKNMTNEQKTLFLLKIPYINLFKLLLLRRYPSHSPLFPLLNSDPDEEYFRKGAPAN